MGGFACGEAHAGGGMRPGLAFRPQELRLALIAAGVIVCWAAVSWVVQPLWDRVRDLRSHVQAQSDRLDALTRMLAESHSAPARPEALAEYLKTEDDTAAQGAFLNALEVLSRQMSLQLNLKPRPGKRDGRVSQFEIELDVEGSQPHLMAFLDALLQMPKAIAFERLTISTVPAKDNLLRANLILQKLTFH